jgi:hypothetical protein
VVGTSDTEFVSLLNDLKYQEIAEYLAVGSGEDTIKRPVVSVRNLKSSVTIRPGSVVKLASFTYEKDSNSQSGLVNAPLLSKRSSKSMEITVLGRVVVKKYIYE